MTNTTDDETSARGLHEALLALVDEVRRLREVALGREVTGGN